MAALSKIGAFLKKAWATEPVITVSFAIGILVPVRDDGNMPDIPSHPCDKEGPNLEWLKKL